MQNTEYRIRNPGDRVAGFARSLSPNGIVQAHLLMARQPVENVVKGGSPGCATDARMHATTLLDPGWIPGAEFSVFPNLRAPVWCGP